MGSTHWSEDHYRERAKLRAATGRSAFEYDEELRALPSAEHQVHLKMNPHGVVVRESRDSVAHPLSRAVGVLFDVTGSMQQVPRILQANLPRLMDLLIQKGYLEHPQILIGGIGDATCDRAPLQVGQFESGIEIEEDLGKLYLEGGGGGHITESYELALYFMAHHTAIDCHEKRGQPGYLFLIGDEIPYKKIKRREVERVIGDKLQADLPVEDVLASLQQRYEVYFIIPRMTSNWRNEEVHSRWLELLGQRVLRLEEPSGICELIASTIGLSEGCIDHDSLQQGLELTGATHSVAQAVSGALNGFPDRRGGVNVPAPGASAARRGLKS
jgi:hypothetical protein